jgi:predicted transcriptional regulator
MDPLEQAKKLREEYERALDAAESRRAAYHEAVLELHRSGKPLREIAKELGLSHQRVHQIVSGEPAKRRSLGRVVGGISGVLVLLAALVSAVWVQSYQPLALGSADVVPAGSYNSMGEKGQVAWVGYRKGLDGGGPLRPFFGFTLQNTGPFSVRLERPSGYGPDLPVLRGWSSQLLMARYTRIKETNPILAQQDQGYRWKRGRFEPYQPTDLAPGQIVMVGYLGHWHDCQNEDPCWSQHSAHLSSGLVQLPLEDRHRPYPVSGWPDHRSGDPPECHQSGSGSTKPHGKHSA